MFYKIATVMTKVQPNLLILKKSPPASPHKSDVVDVTPKLTNSLGIPAAAAAAAAVFLCMAVRFLAAYFSVKHTLWNYNN